VKAVLAAVLLAAGVLVVPASGVDAAVDAAYAPTLPEQLRRLPANQTQLVTVEVAAWGRRDALLSMWGKRADGHWVRYGYASARLGSRGMVPGQNRRQDTYTTPSGRYTLPLAFGRASSSGYKLPYRLITSRSYWCLDNASAYYNRWVEQRPMTVCRASESEYLPAFREYRRAVQIGFNLAQVRGRGGGIFIHDHGTGYTAGCVSVSPAAMDKLSLWLRSSAHPTVLLGTRAAIINQ
jgi:L,D-peptidoglycan transpeptidase YkuD (ErfK/YbiS/YcfS/YnhG family)